MKERGINTKKETWIEYIKRIRTRQERSPTFQTNDLVIGPVIDIHSVWRESKSSEQRGGKKEKN